ncbi:hypothetical protein GCM10027051_09010 [Niabella terrae]
MNTVKKILGFCWLILSPIIVYFLIAAAFRNIDPAGDKDINDPIIWIIIIGIFVPIAIGLMIFGWYALKGEYDHLPERSGDLNFD